MPALLPHCAWFMTAHSEAPSARRPCAARVSSSLRWHSSCRAAQKKPWLLTKASRNLPVEPVTAHMGEAPREELDVRQSILDLAAGLVQPGDRDVDVSIDARSIWAQLA